MMKWLYNLLVKIRNRKRSDVLRLRWQKAELEKLIEQRKKEQEKK